MRPGHTQPLHGYIGFWGITLSHDQVIRVWCIVERFQLTLDKNDLGYRACMVGKRRP